MRQVSLYSGNLSTLTFLLLAPLPVATAVCTLVGACSYEIPLTGRAKLASACPFPYFGCRAGSALEIVALKEVSAIMSWTSLGAQCRTCSFRVADTKVVQDLRTWSNFLFFYLFSNFGRPLMPCNVELLCSSLSILCCLFRAI